ncbi:ribonuclease HII [Chitinophagaceae bacterium 26-R-25]|nr:ribonuclease HII [Chitinophagaceae bacterium 26-R-25]
MEKFYPLLQAYHHETLVEAGCDEAGRGCFAGPVFAAAVILPKDFFHPELNDSKQIKESLRDELKAYIEEKAICYAVAQVTVDEIDEINILNASFKAMHLAIKKLQVMPEQLLIDGNRFKAYKKIPHQCIIKGDGIYASIAAASILAKTYRDAYMKKLHNSFPHYNWKNNKGYGTEEHRTAIEQHGLCLHHRKSFNIVSAQMDLFD